MDHPVQSLFFFMTQMHFPGRIPDCRRHVREKTATFSDEIPLGHPVISIGLARSGVLPQDNIFELNVVLRIQSLRTKQTPHCSTREALLAFQFSKLPRVSGFCLPLWNTLAASSSSSTSTQPNVLTSHTHSACLNMNNGHETRTFQGLCIIKWYATYFLNSCNVNHCLVRNII